MSFYIKLKVCRQWLFDPIRQFLLSWIVTSIGMQVILSRKPVNLSFDGDDMYWICSSSLTTTSQGSSTKMTIAVCLWGPQVSGCLSRWACTLHEYPRAVIHRKESSRNYNRDWRSWQMNGDVDELYTFKWCLAWSNFELVPLAIIINLSFWLAPRLFQPWVCPSKTILERIHG